MSTLLELVNAIEVTSDVYEEAFQVCKSSERDQKLYIWNITPDSYDYVICNGDDNLPEVVTRPFLKKFYFLNAGTIISSPPIAVATMPISQRY